MQLAQDCHHNSLEVLARIQRCVQRDTSWCVGDAAKLLSSQEEEGEARFLRAVFIVGLVDCLMYSSYSYRWSTMSAAGCSRPKVA